MSPEPSPASPQPSRWRRAWRFCFAIEPMRHRWYETLSFRLVIAFVAWLTIGGPAHAQSQPHPTGLAAWGIDFSWLGREDVSQWLVPLLAVCLLLYVALPLGREWLKRARPGKAGALGFWLDWGTVAALSPALLASLGHGTLGNSQGQIDHATQIVTVALLAQWIALVWAAWRRNDPARLPRGYDGQQLAADWTRQLIAATYVASALTKLWLSKGNWLHDTPYIGLQIIKTTEQAFYTYLAPPDNAAWMGQFLIDHPGAARVMIGAGLPLELLVFLGLHNRRSALFFGLACAGFHTCVTEMMHLGFTYHKLLMLGLFANPLYWLVAGCRMLWPGERRGVEEIAAEDALGKAS